MAAWYDYLTGSGRARVSKENIAINTANAFRKNLGYEGDTFKSTFMDYDQDGNETGYKTQTTIDPTKASGILADNTMNPNKMRLAADLMEVQSPMGNTLAMSELNNSQTIENLNRDIERSRIRSEQSRQRIRNARGANNTPQPSAAPARIPPMTPPQAGNVLRSPNAGAIPSPGNEPIRTAPASPMVPPISPLDTTNRLGPTGYVNQPASNEPTIDEQASQINSIYNDELYYATTPAEVSRIENIRKSKLDQLYGKNNTTFERNFKSAKKDIPNLTRKEYKNWSNKIMTNSGEPRMVTNAEKLKLGMVDNRGRPVKTPMLWDRNGEPKAVNIKLPQESERKSAAFAGMMEALEPQIEALTPESGWDQDMIRQELAETLNWLPINLSNIIKTNGRDESGATIKEEEMEKYKNIYFPRAFDSDSTIKFKKQLRSQAVAGMRMKGGQATGDTANVFMDMYRKVSSANAMVFKEFKGGYVYGTDQQGREKRVKLEMP